MTFLEGDGQLSVVKFSASLDQYDYLPTLIISLMCRKIVAALAKSVGMIIVGSTFLGFGCGIVFVSYAGISELLPNKWR